MKRTIEQTVGVLMILAIVILVAISLRVWR
jgi:hypothetical protein